MSIAWQDLINQSRIEEQFLYLTKALLLENIHIHVVYDFFSPVWKLFFIS